MVLKRDIYRAFEDAVGAENISDEPAILDSYAYQLFGEFIPKGKGERFVFSPEAVILPGNTEEVQAVVKTCNRYKIRFKAFSTGWGTWAGPGSEGVIQIDLRRMNRILEINERNMYAVVEPYVINARLQAELMKHGLNCNIITAGSQTTSFPLAALDGFGYSSIFTSMNPRNILGVEWVLPTGEVLRLGSTGVGAGWFCGDGPGPSLRSLVRGIYATEGGIGVFTKAATKVYHWPGPPVPPAEIEGVSPTYTMKTIPKFRSYYLFFPSWREMVEAGIRIAESEIAYILGAIPQYQLAADIAISNEEITQLFPEVMKSTNGLPSLLVGICAISQREFDYQEKVLYEILGETKGEFLALVEEDNIQGGVTWRFTRVSAGVRQWLRANGGTAMVGPFLNWDRLVDVREEAGRKTIQKHIQKGLILDDGGDGGMSLSIEYNHLGMSAPGWLFDPIDTEARQASSQATLEYIGLGREKYRFTVPPIFAGAALNDMLGTSLSNYHLWQRKIKKAFDPNVASDPTHYIDIKPPSKF